MTRDETSPIVTRGKGLWLETNEGNRLLDAVSGTFNLPLGYNHDFVVQAVKDQVERCSHLSSNFAANYSSVLIDRLVSLAPPEIDSGWCRDVTGSTAVEFAVKIAQKRTGATDVISLFRSHHGQTHFTTSISGSAKRRRGFPGAMSGFSVKVPEPYCYRCFYRETYPQCNFLCVDRIREFIRHSSSGSVACLLIEPILGNGGNILPPPGYCNSLRQLCTDEGIVLIADEVQTGVGRAGYMFASEALELDPDVIVLSKGLGGIGLPIAAVLMKAELNVLEKFQHSFTSGANLLGIVAANATLEILSESFLEAVRRKGRCLGTLLNELQAEYSVIGDVRGMGMMWGLEIVASDGAPDSELANTIVDIAESNFQLILRSSEYGEGNVVKVRPALIATEEELREIVRRLSQTLRACGCDATVSTTFPNSGDVSRARKKDCPNHDLVQSAGQSCGIG